MVVRLSSRIISGENTACTSNVPGRRFRPGVSSGSGEGSTLSAVNAAHSASLNSTAVSLLLCKQYEEKRETLLREKQMSSTL